MYHWSWRPSITIWARSSTQAQPERNLWLSNPKKQITCQDNSWKFGTAKFFLFSKPPKSETPIGSWSPLQHDATCAAPPPTAHIFMMKPASHMYVMHITQLSESRRLKKKRRRTKTKWKRVRLFIKCVQRAGVDTRASQMRWVMMTWSLKNGGWFVRVAQTASHQRLECAECGMAPQKCEESQIEKNLPRKWQISKSRNTRQSAAAVQIIHEAIHTRRSLRWVEQNRLTSEGPHWQHWLANERAATLSRKRMKPCVFVSWGNMIHDTSRCSRERALGPSYLGFRRNRWIKNAEQYLGFRERDKPAAAFMCAAFFVAKAARPPGKVAQVLQNVE